MLPDSNIFLNVKTVLLVTAHPDDETLWAGGTILTHPEIRWTIITLTRKSDIDRAPKFFKAAEIFNAKGFMADLDDGPEQNPLEISEIQSTILNIIAEKTFDVIITHHPQGEYTRHRRHEEVSLAVSDLVKKQKLKCKRLLFFAYEDGEKKYPPRPRKDADIMINLPKNIRQHKKNIIIKNYGFTLDSFEANAASNVEAFKIQGQ